MTDHTPTPWQLTFQEDYTGHPQGDYAITGANHKTVMMDTTYYPSAPSQLDAAFIIRAVNSHDALVAALDLLVRDCKEYEAWARPCYALNVAEAALKLARGEA